jgi:YidC/Oxa1 family membrane protein insertase
MFDTIWNSFILDPMVNLLLWFYGLLGQNYLLAIIVFTALTRLITYPLTMQQQKSTTSMQEMQPQLNKLKEKYKSDQETLNRKTMELYQEAGINPLGGCLPMLVQFPILIGLYNAMRLSLAAAPMELITLSQHIYQPVPDWLRWLPDAASQIPLNSRFAWLNLASPDPLFILPVVVFVTTWLQNKLITPPSSDPQQAAMAQSMQLTMPLMIGYFALNFPSGLAIYWVVGNIITFVQYMMMGKASLRNLFGTEDGSFSWRGLIGLAQPEAASGRSRSRSKK